MKASFAFNEMPRGDIVYALCDDRGRVRYIGRTNRSMQMRLSQHRYPNRTDTRPISDFMRVHQKAVTIEQIEHLPGCDGIEQREKYWIRAFLAEGAPLLNISHVLPGNRRTRTLGHMPTSPANSPA